MRSVVAFSAACLTVYLSMVSAAPSPYDSRTAAEKENILWAALTSNVTSYPWPSQAQLAGLFTENMVPTFKTVSDLLPAGRKKLIHTEGYVGLYKFVPKFGATQYTGGFSGSDYVIGRFSFAGEPTPQGIIPASAWKFLVDGEPSADMFAMRPVIPQASWNYFESPFMSHLPLPPGPQPLLQHFLEATWCVRALGVSNVASVYTNGSKVASGDVKTPFKLVLAPLVSMPNNPANNYTALFTSFEPGTAIMDVQVMESPSSELESIGTLELKTRMTPSWFGDSHLFFQHQSWADDLSLNPQWSEETNITAICSSK